MNQVIKIHSVGINKMVVNIRGTPRNKSHPHATPFRNKLVMVPGTFDMFSLCKSWFKDSCSLFWLLCPVLLFTLYLTSRNFIFLLSELYNIVFISRLARVQAYDFSIFHFLVNVILLYSFLSFFFFFQLTYLRYLFFEQSMVCWWSLTLPPHNLPIAVNEHISFAMSENSFRFISLRVALALLSLSFAMSSPCFTT